MFIYYILYSSYYDTFILFFFFYAIYILLQHKKKMLFFCCQSVFKIFIICLYHIVTIGLIGKVYSAAGDLHKLKVSRLFLCVYMNDHLLDMTTFCLDRLSHSLFDRMCFINR